MPSAEDFKVSADDVPRVGTFGPAFQTPVSTRVTGGEIADPAQFPGVVGVFSVYWTADATGDLQSYGRLCTGSVISPTKVLTAGHCTVDLPMGATYVIAGRANLFPLDSGVGTVAQVAATWTHQEYALSIGQRAPVDDVAVLSLKQALPAVYVPVSLSAQGDNAPYAAGTNAQIVGYGSDAAINGVLGVLRKAIVPVKSDATCTADYSNFYKADRMFCAGVKPDGSAPGIDTCKGDSGGPVLVGGIQVGIADWGAECPTYGVYERISYYRNVIDTDLARSAAPNLDWSGDGHSDLLARDKRGNLVEFDGSGLAYIGTIGSVPKGFSIPRPYGELGIVIDSGWSGYTKIFRVSNWLNDGKPSIMGRDAIGRLWMHKSDGFGGFDGSRIQVGSGWNRFTDIMITSNWTGNGRPNLMGRQSNGALYLYTSNGIGGWENNGTGIKIGSGWNGFNTVLTPGDWRGNGQALIGRTPAGELKLYESDGHGGWKNNGTGIKIGTGWQTFTIFMSPGDWNGDNLVDLIGVRSNGRMWMYNTDGRGKWLNDGSGTELSPIGTFSPYNMIF